MCVCDTTQMIFLFKKKCSLSFIRNNYNEKTLYLNLKYQITHSKLFNIEVKNAMSRFFDVREKRTWCDPLSSNQIYESKNQPVNGYKVVNSMLAVQFNSPLSHRVIIIVKDVMRM